MKSALGFGLLVLGICIAIVAVWVALMFAVPAEGATLSLASSSAKVVRP
jgi:hypothetical protein